MNIKFRSFLFLISFAFSPVLSYSQIQWHWAQQGDSAAANTTYDAVDNNDDAFYTGSFSGHSIYFGNTSLFSTSNQSDFIVKYDVHGNFQWAKNGQELENFGTLVGNAVAADWNNNVIETGTFSDSVAFGPFKLISAPNQSPFLVKYDVNGNVLWAVMPTHLNSSAQGNYVASDTINNMWEIGTFQDSISFGNTQLHSNNQSAYLVKYNSSGNVIWARQIVTHNNGSATGNCVAVDDSGNAYISGQMSDSLYFGSIGISSHPFNQGQIYLAKYDSSGNCKWAVNIPADWGGTPTPVAVDHSGDVYISAQFSNNFTLAGTNLAANAGGCSNSMLAKFDHVGNAIWALCARVVSVAEVCVIVESSVATDKCNNVYWSGIVSDTFALGHVYITEPGSNTNIGRPFTYIVKMDSNGNAIGGAGLTNQNYGNFFTNGLAVDNHSHVAFDASLTAPNQMEVGNDTVKISSGGSTPFIAQFTIGPEIVTGSRSSHDSICIGDSTQLKIIPEVGTTLLWSTGETTDSIYVKPTTKTTYYVVVTNSCILDTSFVTIGVKPLPTITVHPPNDTICVGNSVTLTASGGSTYQWTPTTGLSCSICASPSAHPTILTDYKVTGTLHGCKDTSSALVVVNPVPVHTVTVVPATDSICPGDSAHLSASGGNTYLWAPINSTASSVWVKPTVNTTYSLAISFHDCIVDTNINIKIRPLPAITLTPPDTLCFGDSVTLTATGGGTYLWSNNSTNSSIKVSPANTTSYTVIVDKVCLDSASTKVTVDVPSLTVCCNDTIIFGSSANLSASGATSYLWTPSTGLSCTNCPNPIASPTVTTTYTITSNDAGNCSLQREVTVYVEPACADFTVPNVFTPNNDGINDYLVITMVHPTAYSITIFDRWGRQVFSSTNINDYWNGKINGTGSLVPDGVYYYTIKATCDATYNYTKKGFVEVDGEK
jgi:gliding motility-associated-like protein